ncbi:hypothetical protein V6N13_054938 [Hibiscus sabdariffa]
MNSSEANSLQIRNLGDEHRNSTETLTLEANRIQTFKDTHSQLIHLRGRESTISYGLHRQKETLDHLQLASDELNSLILPHKHKRRSKHTQGYQSWISHGSSNLVVERKLIKEMATSQHKLNDLGLQIRCGNMDKSRYSQMLEEPKQIDDRKKRNANIFNPLTVKNAIEEKIKIAKRISLELREEQREVKLKTKHLEKQLKHMKDEAFVYHTRRPEMSKRKEAARHCILKLRQTSVEMNDKYDEYVSLMSNARELCRNKDIAALSKLSHHQVEEFMSEWNQSYVKTFRVNYEFSILDSLRNRRLCHDGRIEFWDEDRETLRYIEDESDNRCLNF